MTAPTLDHSAAAIEAGDHLHATPDAIDITTLFGRIARRTPRLLAMSAALAGLTWVGLSLVAPRYTSEAQLAIVPKDAGAGLTEGRAEMAGGDVGVRLDKEAVNTHVRALMSPDLASRIAADMKLDTRPEFNSRLGPVDAMSGYLRLIGLAGPRADETAQDGVQATYFRQLEIYAARESRLIGIKVTSIDPALAADLANRIAESYRDELAHQSTSARDEAESALKPRIAKLADEAKAAEMQADAFRGHADIFKGGAQNTGLKEQELAELTAELTRAKSSRSELEARARQARELVAVGNGEVLADVQRSPLIQNLVQSRVRVERSIAELSATLLPAHPRMRQLEADRAGLKKQITAEVGKLAESFDKDAKVANLREASVQKSLEELKGRVVIAGTDNATLRALESTAHAKRAELEKLEAQFEASRVRPGASSQPVEVRIITRARAASVPTFPKAGANTALIGLATFIFGLALTITHGLIAGARPAAAHPLKVRIAPKPKPALKTRDAERAQLPTGGAVPTNAPGSAAVLAPVAEAIAPIAPVDAVAPGDAVAREHQLEAAGISSPVRAYRSVSDLAATIAACRAGAGGVRTLLSGETQRVDPAQDAMALAQALAATGAATILVDWCSSGVGEGEGIAALAGLGEGPGLAQLLSGTAAFEAVIRPVPGQGYHFLGAGARASQSAHGSGQPAPNADEVNLVLDALDEAYGQIVVAGRHDDARALFEAILGRFDTGVVVAEPQSHVPELAAGPAMFLGFEVTDLVLLKLERRASGVRAGTPAPGTLARARMARG